MRLLSDLSAFLFFVIFFSNSVSIAITKSCQPVFMQTQLTSQWFDVVEKIIDESDLTLPLSERQFLSSKLQQKKNMICIKNVPTKYKMNPYFYKLIYDPARKEVSPQTIREALAAINLVENYFIPGPIIRADESSFADFFSGSGDPIDIKLPSSPRTTDGRPLNIVYLLCFRK